jgi:MFS family permease
MSKSTTNRAVTVVALLFALSTAALEGTAVTTAMPTIAGELGGLEYYAWVSNVYTIAGLVTMPIFGKLADIFGRKPLILFGIVCFLVGSILCGAARSMEMLIIFRAIQGIGGGAMQSTTVTINGDLLTLEERGKVQGAFAATGGFFGLIGPIVGGVVVRYVSWRWVFFMNIPFAAASIFMLIFFYHERIATKQHKVDYAGASLLTVAVLALLVATGRSGMTVTLAGTLCTIFFFTWFAFVERRAADPVLPLTLFGKPIIVVASLMLAISGGITMALLTYIPLYVQSVLQGTATDAGTTIAPMVLFWAFGAGLAGRLLVKIGIRPLIQLGSWILLAAGFFLALFGADVSLNVLRVTSAIFGLGLAFSSTPLVVAVQSSVGWEERGVATASTSFFRTIGSAISVSVLGGVIATATQRDPTIPRDAMSKLLSHEGMSQLEPGVLARLGGLFQGAFETSFWIIAGLAAIGFCASLWFPLLATTPVVATTPVATTPQRPTLVADDEDQTEMLYFDEVTSLTAPGVPMGILGGGRGVPQMGHTVIMVNHGAPPLDFPPEQLARLKTLEGWRVATKGEMTAEEAELDKRIRRWPRSAETDPCRESVEALGRALQWRLNGATLILAYNEFCAPTLPEAIATAVGGGAKRITVVPSMLSPSDVYTEAEIGKTLEAMRAQYPEVDIRYKWLFERARMAQMLAEHVATLE